MAKVTLAELRAEAKRVYGAKVVCVEHPWLFSIHIDEYRSVDYRGKSRMDARRQALKLLRRTSSAGDE